MNRLIYYTVVTQVVSIETAHFVPSLSYSLSMSGLALNTPSKHSKPAAPRSEGDPPLFIILGPDDAKVEKVLGVEGGCGQVVLRLAPEAPVPLFTGACSAALRGELACVGGGGETRGGAEVASSQEGCLLAALYASRATDIITFMTRIVTEPAAPLHSQRKAHRSSTRS